MNSYTNTVTYASDQHGANIGISTSNGDDIKVFNNISIIDANWNGKALSSAGTTNLIVEDNLIFGTNGTISLDPDITAIEVNTTIADPLFENTAIYDFRLQAVSPAIDIANNSYSPLEDFYGNLRDNNPDLGAIEYALPLSTSEFNLSDINIYPNPFTERIIIDQIFKIDELSIYNILG